MRVQPRFGPILNEPAGAKACTRIAAYFQIISATVRLAGMKGSTCSL